MRECTLVGKKERRIERGKMSKGKFTQFSSVGKFSSSVADQSSNEHDVF